MYSQVRVIPRAACFVLFGFKINFFEKRNWGVAIYELNRFKDFFEGKLIIEFNLSNLIVVGRKVSLSSLYQKVDFYNQTPDGV